jgi:hypothetical protein
MNAALHDSGTGTPLPIFGRSDSVSFLSDFCRN